MRAIMVAEFGAPEVLRLVELPTPEPGPGQLRIEVAAAGVGWLDALIRRGGSPIGTITPPFVPGGAVAGVVSAIGAEVDPDWLGATVTGRPEGRNDYGGGYADTAIMVVDKAFRLPDGVDARTAVAVLHDGSGALGVLERTPVRAQDTVLVAPGVGGLGSLLVQAAAATGARVIAAVRGAEKVALAGKLGVDAIDYAEADWAEGLRADVVFDGIGGPLGARLLAAVPDGGRFSSYGMAAGAPTEFTAADRARLTVTDMSQLREFRADEGGRVVKTLAEVAAGRLTPIIGRTYPLADASRAHEDIEARRFVGKLVLLP